MRPSVFMSLPYVHMLMRPKILIIGYGFVGKTIARSLVNRGYQIAHLDKYDKFEERHCAEAAIVCVDTPTIEYGKQDVGNVDSALAMLERNMPGSPVMLKSTVMPEYAALLASNVTYSPEFIRQGNGYADFEQQEFMLLGAGEFQANHWQRIFRYLKTEYVQCTPEAAAWCKYMHNTFLATKVAFFHELDRIADEMHGDGKLDKSHFFEGLAAIHQFDSTVGGTHLYAPNLDGVYGYGGKCFPKDMEAFATWTKSPHLRQIIRHNEKLNGKRPKHS